MDLSYKNSLHLPSKPNSKVVKNFLTRKNKNKIKENCQITNQQLSSDIELTQDYQFERLSWLLSIIASIVLVNVTVVIMVQFIIFQIYNDQFLTHRKVVQHQTKGKISSLIIPSSFRLTEFSSLNNCFFFESTVSNMVKILFR